MNKADDITPESNREVILAMDQTLKAMAVAVLTLHDRVNLQAQQIQGLIAFKTDKYPEEGEWLDHLEELLDKDPDDE